MEQLVRDARINMIYEGTNGIQALDLLGRKILQDNGAKLKVFAKHVQAFVEANAANAEMMPFIAPIMKLGDTITKVTTEVGMKAFSNADEVGAASVDYLRLVGHLVYGYFWAQMAKIAMDKIAADGDAVEPFYKAKLMTAQFYFDKLFPETAGLVAKIRTGGKSVMQMEEVLF